MTYSTFTLIVATVVAVVTAIFVVITIYIAYVHRKYAHLPGPIGSFYFGNALQLKSARKLENGINPLFLRWSEEFGSCFKVHIFHITFVTMTGVPFIKEFLTKTQYSKARSIYHPVRYILGVRFLGDGLFSQTDHDKWHRRRAIINPAFQKKYLRLFMERFNDIGDAWINKLTSLADTGEKICLIDYLSRVALDSIAIIGFNDNMNAIDRDDSPYLLAIQTMLKGLVESLEDPLLKINPSKSTFRKSIRESITFLRNHGQKLISERVELMKSGAELQNDMLTSIIQCKERDESLTDEDLLDDFLTLFVAGQDTTASSLAFLFLEIGRRPEVIQRMVDEIDSVLEGRAVITFDDLSKLSYTDCVIKEVLRLYPPGPMTARETSEQVTIENFRIPANSTLFFPLYAIQRRGIHHSDAEEFKPERFLTTEPKSVYTYLPFSIGHRSCIGKQFALMESKVLICKFIQKFAFQLDPNQYFGMSEVGSIRPTSGTIMTINMRDN